jgi:hypothetical protein
MKNYTTLETKGKIDNNKDISKEIKEEENKKAIISNDAFAICDFIEQLNNKLESLRISNIMRR